MWAGTPVVVSDSGALPEVVGRFGVIVPEDDVEALAAVLRHLLEHPEERRLLASQARERVAREYSPGVLAERLALLWRQVSSEHPDPER